MLFFINIPKIAVSAKCSVIRLQRLLYFCAEILLYYSTIFVGGGARFSFVSRRRVPSLATNTHTIGFLKVVQLYGA